LTHLRQEASPGAVRKRSYVSISDRVANYLDKCARIRNITRASLLRRLLATITEHQMVGNILDDEHTMREHHKGEHRYKDRGSLL